MNKIMYIVGLIILFSCGYNCENKANIKVTELLYNHTSNRGIKYCEILKGAVNGESDKLSELLNLDIYEAASYDHGIVLVDLVNYFGEEKFIELTDEMSNETKEKTLYNLEVGLLYYQPTIKADGDLESEFPLLMKKWK